MTQIYAPNRLSAGALPQTHWGSLHRSPDPLAGLGVGPTGNGKEGREGRGGRPGMPKSRVGKPKPTLSLHRKTKRRKSRIQTYGSNTVA